jgi:hypothetical protein
MKLWLLLIGLFLSGCCKPEIKEVIIYDTIDNTCYACIDSAFAVKQAELDSLTSLAIAEVDSYRLSVDLWQEKLLAWADSIQKLHVHDNLIIYADSLLDSAEARFDSITGKPYLKIEHSHK